MDFEENFQASFGKYNRQGMAHNPGANDGNGFQFFDPFPIPSDCRNRPTKGLNSGVSR